MIARDKSLAAQCLQMANSPLFGRWQKVDSLRAAVVGLGFQRVSDIAMSCSVLSILPKECTGIDPVVFWEHSLGCALVCRHFARKISWPDPGKAYLAGLLHDLGIITLLTLAYVDDMLAVGKELSCIQKFKANFTKYVNITNLGELKYILSIQV